jgi:hypothetical protein
MPFSLFAKVIDPTADGTFPNDLSGRARRG